MRSQARLSYPLPLRWPWWTCRDLKNLLSFCPTWSHAHLGTYYLVQWGCFIYYPCSMLGSSHNPQMLSGTPQLEDSINMPAPPSSPSCFWTLEPPGFAELPWARRWLGSWMPRIRFLVDSLFPSLFAFPWPFWLMVGSMAVPVGPRDVCLSTWLGLISYKLWGQSQS